MEFDLNEALEQLALAFNTSVDKLYPLLIKQAYISGVVSIVQFLGALGLVFLIWKMAKKSERKYNADSEYEYLWDWEDEGAPWVLGLTILSIVAGFSFFIMMREAPTALLNPEYWALKEVLSRIKY